jgi:ribosomal protein L20
LQNHITHRSQVYRDITYFVPVFKSQSLEVSKIKKNKKNFGKVWLSIINKGSYEMPVS